ncbi:MAG TPA: response regulator [Stellaceae bacterium]|nr:response regulator [Stellaceae bacterium]
MTAAAVTAAEPGRRLAGLTVLIVEDESIISFLVEDMLKDIGCTTVLHASGVAEALALLAAQPPDAAVLDVNLAGEMVFPVAERLQASGIPFIFTTGYGLKGMPPNWALLPVVQKPFKRETLTAALASAVGR